MTDPIVEGAQSLVKKAISFYKTAGKKNALIEFMDPDGQFVQDEMSLLSQR